MKDKLTIKRLNIINPKSLFIMSVILFLSSFVMLIAAFNLEHPEANIDAKGQAPFAMGTTIKQGNVAMSVDKVTYSDGEGVFTAPEGKHYAIVTFTVKNRSDRQVMVMPSSDTYMKDQSGNVVYLTPYELESPFHSGELPPGEQVRGELSYLVPKSTPFKLYIDAIWSGGVIPITIK